MVSNSSSVKRSLAGWVANSRSSTTVKCSPACRTSPRMSVVLRQSTRNSEFTPMVNESVSPSPGGAIAAIGAAASNLRVRCRMGRAPTLASSSRSRSRSRRSFSNQEARRRRSRLVNPPTGVRGSGRAGAAFAEARSARTRMQPCMLSPGTIEVLCTMTS